MSKLLMVSLLFFSSSVWAMNWQAEESVVKMTIKAQTVKWEKVSVFKRLSAEKRAIYFGTSNLIEEAKYEIQLFKVDMSVLKKFSGAVFDSKKLGKLLSLVKKKGQLIGEHGFGYDGKVLTPQKGQAMLLAGGRSVRVKPGITLGKNEVLVVHNGVEMKKPGSLKDRFGNLDIYPTKNKQAIVSSEICKEVSGAHIKFDVRTFGSKIEVKNKITRTGPNEINLSFGDNPGDTNTGFIFDEKIFCSKK